MKKKISEALGAQERRKTLQLAMKRGRDARKAQLAQLEQGDSLRLEVKRIKSHSVSNLDGLIERFTKNCLNNGAKVFFAKDGAQAVDYIMGIVRERGIKLVAKSKSLTTEEIELNKHLEEQGIEVVETDLGERIIQLAKEKPFHLVFPAVHKSQSEVAKLFSESLKTDVPNDLRVIMDTVRKALRPVFLEAGMGITGANVGVAETGTVIIETNEGNAELVTAVPSVHVVVMGLEKIVDTWDEALKLVLAHPVSATGTMLTNYVSMISCRGSLNGHPKRELHIIVLDNGRCKMKDDPWFKDALQCIRCGACMNVCPTYGVVGGHVFGYIYPGPIGIPWTEEIHGLDKASQFAHLCVSCGLCREICPADIDIPMLIAKVKEMDVKRNGQLRANRVMAGSEGFSKFASATAPLSNWAIQSRVGRILGEKLLGVDRRRRIPSFSRRTFEKNFRRIKKPVVNPSGKVVYFPDLAANYNRPELGERAVAFLQDANVEVVLPKGLRSSGMPYISYGELEKATRVAERNVSTLKSFVDQGYDVVATEPTATYCLRKVYPKLLGYSSASDQVAEHSYELFEFYDLRVKGDFSNHRLQSRMKALAQFRNVGFHVSCHQRALTEGRHTLKTLRQAGYNVKVVETGTCCGMAGTFGLKAGPLGYDLSVAVGKSLIDLFNQDDSIDIIATESSVCTWQLAEGVRCQVVHPLDLLVDANS